METQRFMGRGQLERNNMTAEERALDRDNDGRPKKYNPSTNSTTLM